LIPCAAGNLGGNGRRKKWGGAKDEGCGEYALPAPKRELKRDGVPGQQKGRRGEKGGLQVSGT